MSDDNQNAIETHGHRADAALAAAVRDAMPAPSSVPGFDETLAAAEARYRNRRRRVPAMVAAVAGFGLAGLVLLRPDPVVPPAPAWQMADLYERAVWVAPSDVLLPERELDLYSELPGVPESTRPVEGALL